jgi:hypothetical protein
MKIDPALRILTDFALEKANGESLAKRVEIYRAVAALIPASEQRTQVMDLADELEEIERKHRQLLLSFGRDHFGKDGHA